MSDPVYWMEHPAHLTQIRLRAAHERRSQAYWRAVQTASTRDSSHYHRETRQWDKILSSVRHEIARERGRRK